MYALYTLYAFGATVNLVAAQDWWLGLVAQVAAMPDVIDGLLEEHVADEFGRCRGRACTAPGYGTPLRHHPCTLHALAIAALEHRRRARLSA